MRAFLFCLVTLDPPSSKLHRGWKLPHLFVLFWKTVGLDNWANPKRRGCWDQPVSRWVRQSAKASVVPAVMSRVARLDRREGEDEFHLEQLSKLTLSPLLFRVCVCYFCTSPWPHDYSLGRTFKMVLFNYKNSTSSLLQARKIRRSANKTRKCL